MEEETQNSVPDLTKKAAVNRPAIHNAQDRLAKKVAGETSVQQPASPGEEQFMDFIAKKSQEIPKESAEQEKPKPEKEKEEERRKDIIRTYQTDVEDTIRGQKLSLANIAVAESKHAAKQPQKAERPKKNIDWKHLFLNILSVALLVIGLGVLAFFYMQHQQRVEIETSVPENTLALANSNLTLDVTEATRESMLGALDGVTKSVTGNISDVVNVTLVTELGLEPVTAQVFIETLEANSDAAFLRSVEDPFMLGVHIFDAPHFFLILKTTFPENAFAGMLRWEETIADELPFLVRAIPESTTMPFATSTATTTATSQEKEIFNNPTFEDIVLHNKDVRARHGTDGEIDLLYTFTDPETLVITNNPDTLKAVLNRLTIARFKQ